MQVHAADGAPPVSDLVDVVPAEFAELVCTRSVDVVVLGAVPEGRAVELEGLLEAYRAEPGRSREVGVAEDLPPLRLLGRGLLRGLLRHGDVVAKGLRRDGDATRSRGLEHNGFDSESYQPRKEVPGKLFGVSAWK